MRFRRALPLIGVLSLALIFCACGETPPAAILEGTPAPTVTSEPAEETVAFSDPALEAKIRADLGKPEGDITAAQAAELLELDLSGDGTPAGTITDLSALRYFTGLFRLNLSCNAISDLEPLSGLTQLRILDLSQTPIQDVSALSGLNLAKLVLSGCEVTDPSPVSAMAQLRVLDLSGNAVSDVSALAGMPRLETLLLAGNPVVDYRPLSAIYPELTKKDFEIIFDTDVIVFTDPVLEERIRVETGMLEGDITIADAKTITELNLGIQMGNSDGQYHDLSPLRFFVNLTKLHLDYALGYDNGNPDVSALASLTHLKELGFPGCSVADISFLSGMKDLEWLDFQLNSVEDISPMAGLKKLKLLSMCSNPVTDISPLSSLTSLEELFLFGVNPSDFSPLSSLGNLVFLDLTCTGISDLTPLSGLTNLKTLQLGGNPIEDYSPLAVIYPNLENKDFTIR
jgi:internalin A